MDIVEIDLFKMIWDYIYTLTLKILILEKNVVFTIENC